jgi:peptide deformylase
MAKLQVANMGNPILRLVAKSVKKDKIKTKEFQGFLDDLLESMEFHQGVGLAAPQVFRSQRVIAVGVPQEDDEMGKGIKPAVFINPELKPIGDDMEDGWEGCLSLKDVRGVVPRYVKVELKALDRKSKPVKMKLEGFVARVFQHEIDHLDGILFPQRMEYMETLAFEKDLERYGWPGEIDEE